MHEELKNIESMTMQTAASLVKIDPNMENVDEGYAFMRRLYKKKGIVPEKTETKNIPDAPEQCLNAVAGKFLIISDLQDDIDEAVSFRDFYSEIYCGAYVNALVTDRHGLALIKPDSLKDDIISQLQRVYGPFPASSIDDIANYAV